MNCIKISVVGLSLLTMIGCVAVPDGPTRDQKASKLNVQLGISYLQQNNLEVANEKLNKALRQDPDSAIAHNAFAILQDRLLQYDKAETHYRIATELDPDNAQANNNYGTFLCRHERQQESEQYFLKAVAKPLYKRPESAYTNAAICLMQIDEYVRSETYLKKALAARSNFGVALINLSDIYFRQNKHSESLVYLNRFDQVKNHTARSLWLEARNHLALGNITAATKKIDLLQSKFSESKEYQEWKAINK